MGNLKRVAMLRKKLKDYFNACDERGRCYTLAGLKVALGFKGAQWEEAMADAVLGPELVQAVDRIRDALEQRSDSMAVLLRRELASEAPAASGAGVSRVVFGGEEECGAYGR